MTELESIGALAPMDSKFYATHCGFEDNFILRERKEGAFMPVFWSFFLEDKCRNETVGFH